MDSTYRCNNRKMPLSTMMAMDGNGAGQVVDYALLRNERHETLRLFLSKFKELNSATTQTKLFIVDKDFNEMAVLRELWPDAEVFLCLFHILKSLKQRIASLAISQEKEKKKKKKRRVEEPVPGQLTAMMMLLQNLERRHQRSF